MIHLWTNRDRKLLGRALSDLPPFHGAAFDLTIAWARALANAIPSTYDGIALLPIVLHKLAVYNVDLVSNAGRVLRGQAAARMVRSTCLNRRAAQRMVFPFADVSVAEACAVALMRSRCGQVAFRHESARAGAGLASRYPARSETAGFERFEVSVEDCAAGTSAPATDVLFIASMNNYLNPMNPVIAACARAGARTTVLTPTGAENWPSAAGLPNNIERPGLPGPAADICTSVFRREQSRYESLWQEHRDQVSRVFMHDGVDLWPIVARDIERFVKDYFPYAIAMIETGRALADRLGVRSAAVARLRRATELGIVAGLRSRAVPVTMLMHGHISNFPERRFDAGSFDGVDRVCVWGREQADQIEASQWPAPRSRIVPVGNPAWDSLISRPSLDREAIRREVAVLLDLDPRQFWCVLTTQSLTQRHFRAVVDAIASIPGAALITKVHPTEDPAWYRSRSAALPSARVIDHGSTDVLDLLRAGDCTLTFSSTTNLESLLVGTPVLSYTFGDLADQDRAVYLERFGLPVASTAGEMRGILAAAVKDPKGFRDRLAPASARAIDANLSNARTGDAAARAAAMILADAGLSAPNATAGAAA